MDFALLGAGVMGQALAGSFRNHAAFAAGSVRIFDIDCKKAAAFASQIGGAAYDSAAEAAQGAEVVLLAVKPLVVAESIEAILPVISNQTLLISIAAGIPLAKLRSLAGNGPAIARAMPNMPAQVGCAVTALCFDQADPDRIALANSLFQSCGLAFEVAEQQMDAVTGLSGSGPAYALLVIEALAAAGVRQGLPHALSQQMAAMTLQGAARLVLETGRHPAELIDQICTPGGTTAEAMLVLEEAGVRAALIKAVSAAAAKSKSLREPGR